MLFAHAKWFVDDPGRYAIDWAVLVSPWTLAPLLLMVAAVGIGVRRRGRASAWPASADRALSAVPRALAATVGASLVILALGGQLLLPHVHVAEHPLGTLLLLQEAAVGVWLVSGARRTLAAWALLGLSVELVLIAYPLALLEAAYYPGIGAYLVLHERALAGRVAAAAPWRALAFTVGSSLVTVAFTEKLAVPGIGVAVLHAHPELDPLTALGIAPPAITFVRAAGLIEVLLGLLIATGVGGRIVPLMALGPFVATVPIFGASELVGHAAIYVTLVAIAARSRPIGAAIPTTGRGSEAEAFAPARA